MIAGLILAGGSGSRLGGVRKGDIRLRNTSLLHSSAERLAPQVDIMLLSVAEETQYRSLPNVISLFDSPDGVTGPAAGLSAGAQYCSAIAPMMAVMAVDTPFFPHDFVLRTQPMLSCGVGCVMGTYGGRDYPTSALWSIPALLRALADERRADKGPRLRDLAARIGVAYCSFDDAAMNPFSGINTLQDLLALSKASGDV